MKKYLLGLFAVVLAVGFTAFTSAKEQKSVSTENAKFAPVYYKYTGPLPGTPSDWTNPANFTKIVPQPSNIKLVCPSVDVLCAIFVEDNGTHPAAFTQAIKDQIIADVTAKRETTLVELFVQE